MISVIEKCTKQIPTTPLETFLLKTRAAKTTQSKDFSKKKQKNTKIRRNLNYSKLISKPSTCVKNNQFGLQASPNANIAGGLPENSRNSFVDLQSQKDGKTNRPKIPFFN